VPLGGGLADKRGVGRRCARVCTRRGSRRALDLGGEEGRLSIQAGKEEDRGRPVG